MEDKVLIEAIEEYYTWSGFKKSTEKRLKDLNEKIKRGMAEREMITENGDNTFDVPVTGLQAKVTLKKKVTIDESAVWDVFGLNPNLADKYAIETIPDSAIEEAYLNGDIDDDDLRRIKTTDYVLSLEVKNV